MKNYFIIVGLICLAVIIAAAGLIIYVNQQNSTFRGSIINPPMHAPNFTFTSQLNTTASLSDYHGKYVLLFFGFTNCTEECPATMAVLKLVRIDLKDRADNVQVVFVTTDPDRDSPQAIGEFLNRFDTTFIGLTGTTADLQKTWADYGVTVLDGGETHSPRVYLIDPQGNIRLTYPSVITPDDILADLRLLFRKG